MNIGFFELIKRKHELEILSESIGNETYSGITCLAAVCSLFGPTTVKFRASQKLLSSLPCIVVEAAVACHTPISLLIDKSVKKDHIALAIPG